MNCCGDANLPICPCGQFKHPRTMDNAPALDAIAYRAGDYASFRHALLAPRGNETALKFWRPGAQGDLAVQMVEWWAYLADVLTFYNERVASQAYLRTADLPESVNRLIRLLSYRPRPGIGATGLLAALTSGVTPFTLPKGFQIQSKPGPGKKPQIFEVDQDVKITPPVGVPSSSGGQGSTDVKADPAGAQLQVGNDNSVLLAGASSAIKKGDRVLLLPTDASVPPFVIATATSITHEKDAQGKPITRVVLAEDPAGSLRTIQNVKKYRILESDQSSQVWQYLADDKLVILAESGKLNVQLVSIARGLKSNDPIVFEGFGAPQYGTLINSTELVWFANPLNSANPDKPPTAVNVPAIPIPHTLVKFAWNTGQPPDNTTTRPTYLVRYGWKEVGVLIAATTPTIGGNAVANSSGGSLILNPSTTGTTILARSDGKALVEDANGHGAVGSVNDQNQVQIAAPVPVLVPPLRVLSHLLPVSRGKSVVGEVLGNGNALVASQDFMLQNAPVTYLQSADSTSGENYKSTVRVWVNQLEWAEIRSFFGQPPDAQVFLTREDDAGMTHVVFGDGQNGARLPSGVNNVVASYRYGSGADVPAAGTLTEVLQPRPGLRGIRNPVPVGGGAHPDPPAKVRRLAPRSILTFGRAVSVDDFQVIAAQAPGVVRAKAAVAFDGPAQRPRVTVYVGDDQAAVDAAQAAIAAAADPNRLPQVLLAKTRGLHLNLTLVIDRRRDAELVKAAVRSALLDADAGLFGINVVGIGQSFFDSQIYAACLAVPGVTAVHSLIFSADNQAQNISVALRNLRLTVPGVKNFLGRALTAKANAATPVASPCTGPRHNPGEDAFYLLADDLVLAEEDSP